MSPRSSCLERTIRPGKKSAGSGSSSPSPLPHEYRPGDDFVRSGVAVIDRTDVTSRIGNSVPGTKLSIGEWRDAKAVTLSATVSALEDGKNAKAHPSNSSVGAYYTGRCDVRSDTAQNLELMMNFPLGHALCSRRKIGVGTSSRYQTTLGGDIMIHLLATQLRAFFYIALAAMTAASSLVHADTIVGGWGVIDPSGVSGLNFLPDGQYMHIQFGPPGGGGHPGMESGTYSWNASNGAFSSQTGLDRNGEWGLSDPYPTGSCQPANGCVVTAANGVITLFGPGSNPPETSTGFSIGAWYLAGTPGPGDLIVFDLFSNGAYLLAIDPPATGYYVYGSYDSLTGALTPQATDLPAGFSGPDHAIFSGNELVLMGANGQVTLRTIAVPEPAAILLIGLGLLGLAMTRRGRRSIPEIGVKRRH